MVLGIGSVPSDLVAKSWRDIAEESGVVRAMIGTIPPSCLAEDSSLNQYIAAAGEDLDQNRIAASTECSSRQFAALNYWRSRPRHVQPSSFPNKDKRRGPIPNLYLARFVPPRGGAGVDDHLQGSAFARVPLKPALASRAPMKTRVGTLN
jgi:hypothetical protein